MSESVKKENGFIGYEYRDFNVKSNMQSLYADSYTNFGWELESVSNPIHAVGYITLKFKRDRKIVNKTKLNRLQRKFESSAKEIETLENSKGILASAVAYIIGIVGTAFIAGSVFSNLANMLSLSVILAVPGFTGWVIPYFCYSRIRKQKTDEVEPLIDEKYDEIYEICKEANNLLLE